MFENQPVIWRIVMGRIVLRIRGKNDLKERKRVTMKKWILVAVICKVNLVPENFHFTYST